MIINARWKMYADFLAAHGDDYAQIFVCDTRDVICQGDVFKAFESYSNYLGYSTERQLLGDDKVYNYRWLETCFGKTEADKLSDKSAICAGTVIGTVREMKIFCQEMWTALKDATVWGHEQAAINYFVYENLLPIDNLIEIDTYSGAILTNGIIKDNKTRGDKILRGDGGVPAVVHQYDRHAPQVQLVDNVYRDKNFQPDERFTDPRSVVEQVKHLLYLGKTDDAARFFMNVQGADFGGNVERLLNIWEMLLNRPLSPAVGYLELSIQRALASEKNFPVQYLNAACSLLIHSIKNRRAVDPQLVQYIAGGLMNIAEQTLNARNADFCFFCIDALKALDLPPNKDFCLLQAKAYRTFGRKEDALAAYQKALDLS